MSICNCSSGICALDSASARGRSGGMSGIRVNSRHSDNWPLSQVFRALWARSNKVLVTGSRGAARPAYPPACFAWHHCGTRCPWAAAALGVTWSATRRLRWPNADTRLPCRCRTRYHRAGNGEGGLCAGRDGMAGRFPGRLLRAWRRQEPKRAPGTSVRLLLVVLSHPSLRMPRTREAGSGWAATCWTSR
jgi:hypothetical protein